MQLTGHDYFPPGNIDPRFSNWISDTPLLLHQVVTATGILLIFELVPTTPVSFMSQWKYHQLSKFVKSLPQPLRSESELNPVERLLAGDQPPDKTYFVFLSSSIDFASCSSAVVPRQMGIRVPKPIIRNSTFYYTSIITYLLHFFESSGS